MSHNDAKLGLVAGLAAVLVIAVVYYQKPAPAQAKSTPAKVGSAAAPPAVPAAAVPVPAR